LIIQGRELEIRAIRELAAAKERQQQQAADAEAAKLAR
jgi:hypothetical protein